MIDKEMKRSRISARVRCGLRASALSLVLSLSLVSGGTQASGIPVIDAAAISQSIQQILQLKQEYDMIVNQYEQLKTIYGQLSGINSISDLLNATDALVAIPDAASRLYDLSKGASEVLTGTALEIYNSYNLEKVCGGLSDELMEYCIKHETIKAAGEGALIDALDNVQKHYEKFKEIYSMARNARTAKQIADAQAAIEAEYGFLQVEKTRVQLMREGMKAIEERNEEQRKGQMRKIFGTPSGSLTLTW